MQRNNNRQISILRLPIFWLFLGPPVFRVLGERGAMASLEGNYDIWNIIRLIWWLFFGLVATLEIYRLRAELLRFIRSLRLFPWLVGTWLLTLFASAINSPAPAFTLVSAAMMTILVLASLDLGLKLYSGVLDVQRALKLCFGFSVFLLLIFCLTFLVAPDMVGGVSRDFGLRARGGTVADNALLSQVVFFIGIYLVSLSNGLMRGLYRSIVLISPIFLLIAQTRAMYVSFFIGCMVFLLQWLLATRYRQRVIILGACSLALSGVLGLVLYEEVLGSAQISSKVESYLVRDHRTVEGMSGRDVIASIVLRAVSSQPLGLGYSTGPRVLLQNSVAELWQHYIIAHRIGNAHNMYLEILGGSGFLGFAAWLVLLLWLGFRLWWLGPGLANSMIPVRALFIVILLGGFTESYGAFPFYQPSALLWTLAAIIIGFKRETAPVEVDFRGLRNL